MKNELQFPLIFGEKVYYNFEEIPDDVKTILKQKLDSGHEFNYKTLKWEIDGVEYKNFTDIPSNYQVLFEDKDTDQLPEIIEETFKSRQDEGSIVELKQTLVKNYTNESKNNPHKKKFSKNNQYVSGLNYIWIPIIAIVSIILIIYFMTKK